VFTFADSLLAAGDPRSLVWMRSPFSTTTKQRAQTVVKIRFGHVTGSVSTYEVELRDTVVHLLPVISAEEVFVLVEGVQIEDCSADVDSFRMCR
jgi:hypothetical protein